MWLAWTGAKLTDPSAARAPGFAESLPFWEEARGYNLRVGWVQSCFDPRGAVGVLSLSRSCDTLSSNELADNSLKMSYLAMAAHEGMSRLIQPRLLPEADINLSAQEIEVLRWTADGKTSRDVSDIMHISERTINHHLNRAVEKLGACNKTSATVKAAILGKL